MASKLAVAFLLLCGCLPGSLGQGMMRRDSKNSQKASLQTQLQRAIGSVPADRLFAVEESIRPTYEAFPKNLLGEIPAQEIFPSIVRNYFAKEHGWVIKGLEPPSLLAPQTTVVTQARVFQDRAPALLDALKQIEEKDSGLSMSDVVGTIAALEEALLSESSPLLSGAYFLNGVSSASGKISKENLHEVLHSYLLLYRHGTPVNLTDVQGHHGMKEGARNSSDGHLLITFEEEVVASNANQDGGYAFEDVVRIAKDATRKYGKFQDAECMDMKGTLAKLDPHGKGSVPLEAFHSEPAHASYQFTESAEYLRRSGELLEESQGNEVLIANYILGPSNCIASSTYYSVCCLNECETILSEFELKTQSPQSSPEMIASLLAEISSTTKPAPVTVTAELAEGLQATANAHDGAVHLHSADFKAWLHMAFPNECPKPTPPEAMLEEAELAVAQQWLEKQQTCTRLQSWHPSMQFVNYDKLVEI